VMAVALLLFRQRYHLAAMMAAATGGGALASMVLKSLFARPRPAIVPHLIDVSTLSFPSGHATNSAIVYLSIALVLARNFADRPTRVFILASAVGLVVVIGVTRVYLGVHYPSDVAAGWMAGAAWALAMGAITRRLQVEHKVEQPEAPQPDAS
jgi:undecaprenyl-diphosphatase